MLTHVDTWALQQNVVRSGYMMDISVNINSKDVILPWNEAVLTHLLFDLF